MIRVAYFSTATGQVSTIMTGPDLSGFPDAEAGQGCSLTLYEGRLPAYWDGAEVQPVPDRPSDSAVWSWSSKSWVPDIDLAKVNAWHSVKAARNGREFGPFTWGGHVFDGDIDAQRRINLAVLGAQVALAAGQPWSVDWTLADNSFVTLSASEMVGVAEAMGASINAAHEWARGLRIQIESATTIEELEAVWPASS